MTSLSQLKKELRQNADSEKAKVSKSFFKTGKGQYGEGDIFLGINVPTQRKIAKKYFDLTLSDLHELLNSRIHEHRFIALIILVEKYKKCGYSVPTKVNRLVVNKKEKMWVPSTHKSPTKKQKEIFNFYIKNAKKINNWDLVDVSAPYIVGRYILDSEEVEKSKIKKENILIFSRILECDFAKSDNLWKKRIAIVSTFAFIRAGRFDETLRISEMLLEDGHDLIHKAVGWMLREVGKKDEKILEDFLKKHHSKINRTTLRYAIERFPEDLRKEYLSKNPA